MEKQWKRNGHNHLTDNQPHPGTQPEAAQSGDDASGTHWKVKSGGCVTVQGDGTYEELSASIAEQLQGTGAPPEVIAEITRHILSDHYRGLFMKRVGKLTEKLAVHAAMPSADAALLIQAMGKERDLEQDQQALAIAQRETARMKAEHEAICEWLFHGLPGNWMNGCE